MKKFLKGKKAITLIALVITIVILIILAGVLVSITLGNNGLFDKAKLGKELYANAQDYEETEIAKKANEIDSMVSERGNESDINKTIEDSHVSMTASLFSIEYDSRQNSVSAGQRSIADFTDNITSSSEMSTYLQYDETNKKLVCKKSGQYIINISARGQRSTNGGIDGSIQINNNSVWWQDHYSKISNEHIWTGNTMTVYLKKDDTVDFVINNSGELTYYCLHFSIHAN